MDSVSVLVFTSSFAYNFIRKKARITIFGMWVTSRWIMDRLKYFLSEFNTQGRRGKNDDVTALGRPLTFRFRSISLKVLVRLSSNFTHNTESSCPF